MKFSEYTYSRPDSQYLQNQLPALLQQLQNAKSCMEQIESINSINNARKQFDSMAALAQIRHSIDTRDPFYEKENRFYDKHIPIMTDFVTAFYSALIQSPFIDELKDHFGNQLFTIAQIKSRISSPDVLDYLQQENKLVSEYKKLAASAKIPFRGKEISLSQLMKYHEDPDRHVRKESYSRFFSFIQDNGDCFDRIYDDLVQIRHTIARRLSFPSFTEVAYSRLRRSDYNPSMVAQFRKSVREYIVPLTIQLRQTQRKRLGLDTLHAYDESFYFKSNNCIPQGSAEWIIENTKTMFHELSAETDEFFSFMIDHELMDTEAKVGKTFGAYCELISTFKSPFVFTNFNGTAYDVKTFAHECGHAFQVYQCRNQPLIEYYWPTQESSEISSMGMEFMTWPWMNLFFGEQTEKYYYRHLVDSLCFIPYSAAIDEFQHRVYEEPSLSPRQRKELWKDLERMYLPSRSYDGIDFLENGGFWQKQLHVYIAPFYYIDYSLALVCALQLWAAMLDNQKKAWDMYQRLAQQGGRKPFNELLTYAGFQSPFDPHCIESVVETAQQWLKQNEPLLS